MTYFDDAFFFQNSVKKQQKNISKWWFSILMSRSMELKLEFYFWFEAITNENHSLGQLHNVQRNQNWATNHIDWVELNCVTFFFYIDLIEIKLKHWTWNGQFSTAHFKNINDIQCTLYARFSIDLLFIWTNVDGKMKERPMG